ncbi:MAG: VCBS repeat-containing protein, partial [Bacteroidia bacterium]|nr:VCBS repeat-containing protein [Bacteroidia bacterium]
MSTIYKAKIIPFFYLLQLFFSNLLSRTQVNNKNGTFSELNQQAFGHGSRFSMGSDAGDINNDGWLDIITLDMLPEDEKVLKSSASDDPLDVYDFKTNRGYHHQYSK